MTQHPTDAAPPGPDHPAWRRPPITADQQRMDALGAAGLLVGSLLSMVLYQTAGIYDDPAEPWLSLLCLAAVCLPLAVRRRWPSAVAVVVAGVFVATSMAQVPELLFMNICLFIALYTVGAWEPDRRRAAWVRALIIAAMLIWLLVSIFQAVTDPETLPGLSRAGAFSPMVAFMLLQVLTNLLYFGGAYYFGNHAWTSARERERLLWRTRQLQAERRRGEAQAIELERLRLARELHDAVAHHVSTMGVQAAAARTLLAADPPRAALALAHVEDSAREAIGELHSILGMLRDSAVPARADTNGPIGSLGVERIPHLVAQAEQAGLPTGFQVIGQPRALPPLVSLNVYRIAQEALTNARRHGGPNATADVRLRYLDDAVELEVADDGSGPRRAASRSAGHGLGIIGMRERVETDGGTLVAGPRSRGGFLVRATIPLPAAQLATAAPRAAAAPAGGPAGDDGGRP